MEEIVRSIALIVGTAAVAIPSITAAFNVSRLLRTSGNHFVVNVDGREYAFDIDALGDVDVGAIDSATRAVEERAEAHA